MAYLDDLLIVAESPERCLKDLDTTIKELISMGWMLNLRVTSGPSKTIPMTRSPSRLGTDTNLCPRVKVKQNSRLDKFSSQVPFHLT